jgi:hypothetical protein
MWLGWYRLRIPLNMLHLERGQILYKTVTGAVIWVSPFAFPPQSLVHYHKWNFGRSSGQIIKDIEINKKPFLLD